MAEQINSLKAKRMRKAMQGLGDVNFLEAPEDTRCDGLFVSSGKGGPNNPQWLLFIKEGKVAHSCPISASTLKRLRLELQLCKTVTSGAAEAKFYEMGA